MHDLARGPYLFLLSCYRINDSQTLGAQKRWEILASNCMRPLMATNL